MENFKDKKNDDILEKLVHINRITKVVKGLSENPDNNSKIEEEVRNEVVSLCSNFPIYKNLNK